MHSISLNQIQEEVFISYRTYHNNPIAGRIQNIATPNNRNIYNPCNLYSQELKEILLCNAFNKIMTITVKRKKRGSIVMSGICISTNIERTVSNNSDLNLTG